MSNKHGQADNGLHARLAIDTYRDVKHTNLASHGLRRDTTAANAAPFTDLATLKAERDAAIADYVAALTAADDAYRAALRNLTNDSGNHAALRAGVVYDAARNAARAAMLADRAAAIAEQETPR